MASTTPVLQRVQFIETVFEKKPLVSVAGRPFHSLTFRKSGKALIAGGGAFFTSEAGTLTYMPAGCAYHTEILEAGQMFTMHFYADTPLLDAPATIAPPFPLMIENMLAEAVLQYAQNGCDLGAFAAAYRILATALPIFMPEKIYPTRRMRSCKQFIDDHITDPSLRIADLAARCGISEVYFRREFKKFYGDSPLEYIKKRRLELAKMLLETGLYSITEVAFRAGFESSGYFSAEFKRMTGKSPRDYRNT